MGKKHSWGSHNMGRIQVPIDQSKQNSEYVRNTVAYLEVIVLVGVN